MVKIGVISSSVKFSSARWAGQGQGEVVYGALCPDKRVYIYTYNHIYIYIHILYTYIYVCDYMYITIYICGYEYIMLHAWIDL